ncbi:hypothetical protein [Roseomonas sp. BN140053]|uniref:hypothetical protein n=1 Tax=Roseomonas sp. BN140053 TaxID=3391898 RepID=UPI0039ED44D8
MSGIVDDSAPFPAEAELAAVAEVPLGPVGRFQLVCAPGPGGEVAAFVIDTTDGRSWTRVNSRWEPLEYGLGSPMPAP